MHFGAADDILRNVAGCPIRRARKPVAVDPVTGEPVPFPRLNERRAGLSNGHWRALSTGEKIEGLLGMSLTRAAEIMFWPLEELDPQQMAFGVRCGASSLGSASSCGSNECLADRREFRAEWRATAYHSDTGKPQVLGGGVLKKYRPPGNCAQFSKIIFGRLVTLAAIIPSSP
jgi:hypothetical protein